MMTTIEKVLQSNENFTLDSYLRLNVITVDMGQKGGGKSKNVRREPRCEELRKMKRSIIRIPKEDQMCLARSIVVASSRLQWKKGELAKSKYDQIADGRTPIQRKLARALCDAAGVCHTTPCGADEYPKFQSVLEEYQLHIVSRDHFDTIIYKGPEAKEKKIYLWLHQNHFDVIATMAGFLQKVYFCTACCKGYDHANAHVCSVICRHCRKEGCTATKEERIKERLDPCPSCDRYFYTNQCFQNHLQKSDKGTSTCSTIKRCPDCFKQVSVYYLEPRKHRCGKTYCITCGEFLDSLDDHDCYIKPLKTGGRFLDEEDGGIFIPFDNDEKVDGAKEKDVLCFYYDFEAQSEGVHKPNLLVVSDQKGEQMTTFEGDSCAKDFLNWIFDMKFKNPLRFIAHNSSGYDGYFITNALIQMGIKPSIIRMEGRIFSICLPKNDIKFIDSANFVMMPLRKLPQTFGIKDVQKGDFPHRLNCDEWLQYKGDMPPFEFWESPSMDPADKERLEEWHKEKKAEGYVWDTYKELKDYCEMDVKVLRECAEAFRSLFKKNTGIDPFETAITIASACSIVYRTNYLQEEQIAIIPPHGYNPMFNHSEEAMQWLTWESESKGVHIQHARNGGEVKVPVGNSNFTRDEGEVRMTVGGKKYPVDGYDENARTVYQYHGCFWHGCPSCYDRKTMHPVRTHLTMGELYDETIRKDEAMKKERYTVITMWSHTFLKQREEDEAINKSVQRHTFSTPLVPRDALCGGRTETFRLKKEMGPDEKGYYLDFTSLYPFINKTCEYPVGHPKILTATDIKEDISEYFGLIKATVLPPQDLKIPVLPYKSKGKLLFPLCRTCADDLNTQIPCHHDEDQRNFEGTWCTTELVKARELGYRVIAHEVWHFKERSTDLFSGYINTFLKLKQEASGWPEDCETEEEMKTYVEDFEKHENIALNPQNIRKNPGLRALSKLCLNSLWGKFAQRQNLPQVKFVQDPAEYFELLTSDSIEVKDVNILTDEMVEVRYVPKEVFVKPSRNTNVVIAAFTTANARLRLYKYLEMLGDRVLYCDTDSIIFVGKPGEKSPPTGNFLGDLTSELKQGEHINLFISAGPKNYAYRVSDGTSVIKVRGFTLNAMAKEHLNLETMLSMIDNIGDNTIKEVPMGTRIARDTANYELKTTTNTKKYSVIFDKRIICDTNTFETIPYGYIPSQ